MKKQTYLEPAVQVLSLAPMQETLQTMSVDVMAVGAVDLSSPVEIEGTWDSLF